MTMLPREQVVTVALDTGLDTGADPQVATAMAVSSNVTHPRRGAVAKRAGQARSAATVGASSTPSRISRLGDSAVVWGGTAVQRYAPSSDVSYAASYDPTERSFSVRSRSIGTVAVATSSPALQMTPSLALASSYVVTVYDAQLSTYDRETLVPIDSVSVVAGSRVLRRADGSIIAVVGSTTTGIRTRVIGADGTIGAEVVATTTNCDRLACALVGSDVYVAWRVPSGSIMIGRMAGGSPASWTEAVVDAIAGVTSFGTGLAVAPNAAADGVVVAWSRTVGGVCSIATAVYDASLTAVASMATVTWIGSATVAPSQMAVVANWRTGSSASTVATVYASGSVGSASTALRGTQEVSYSVTAGVGSYSSAYARTRYGAMLAAAPITYGAGEWVIPWYSEAWGAAYPDAATHQGQIVISGCGADYLTTNVGVSSYRPVASVASGYARQIANATTYEAAKPSDTVYRTPGTVSDGFAFLAQIVAIDSAVASQRGDVYGLRLVEVTPDAAGATIEHDGAVLIPGALPRETDGASTVEAGWLQYPEPIWLGSTAAGALSPGSSYSFCATYEHVDARGRKSVSASTPLPLVFVPSAGGELPTIRVGPLAHSLRGRATAASGARRVYGSQSYVVLWRTAANGSIYYRCTEQPVVFDVAYLEFSTGTDVTDAVISTREVLPTTGGVLAAAPPPPYVAQTMWQGRHVVVDADRQELRYSRATAVGAPIQHALELAQPLRLEGTVTALDAIGGRLIIMTDRAIYATDGTGYDDIGQGQPLADPYLLSSLVGCSDARSVARLPQGIAFLGGSRIWLLDSGLSLQPLGEPVRYYTAAHTYRDAVPLQSRTSVAWTSATGPALVYDAVHGRWSTWDTHTCVGACASSTGMLRLASDYRVWRPAADTAGDDGAWVTMDLATGWLAIADWQRVAEIEVSGYYVSRCAIRLRVQYDYVPVDVDDVTYTPAASGLLVSPSSDHWGAGLGASYLDRALRISHSPSHTQCSALRVRITDAREGSEALGAGAEWATVRVRLQAEAGVQRLDRSRRTG